MFEIYVIGSLAVFAYLVVAGFTTRHAALMGMAWPLSALYWIGMIILGVINLTILAKSAYRLDFDNHTDYR